MFRYTRDFVHAGMMHNYKLKEKYKQGMKKTLELVLNHNVFVLVVLKLFFGCVFLMRRV